MNSTIEIVEFSLNDCSELAAFLDAQKAFDAVLAEVDGFYYRTLIQNSAYTFTDIVHWESEAKAKAALEALMPLPEAQDLMRFVDEASVTMRYTPALSEIAAKQTASV